MRTVNVLLLISCFGAVAFAQPPDTLWTRIYNHDAVFGTGLDAVAPVPDNGFYVCGHCCYDVFSGTPYVDALVARMDAAGFPLWASGSITMTGAEAYDIQSLPDGGCIAGLNAGLGYLTWPPSITRWNAQGNELWTAMMLPGTVYIGTDNVMSVCRLPDGAFAATGIRRDSSSIMRADSTGNVQWVRPFHPHRLFSIAPASGSDFVVAGTDEFFLARISSAGDTVWTRQFAIGPYSRCRKVIATPEGDYFMVGGSGEAVYTGAVAKVSADGELLWQHTYDFSPEFVAADRCAEGGYILLSNRLVRVAENGDTLWTQTLPCDTCVYRGLTQTTDSGYVVVGYSGNLWFGDGYLVKFAREGLPISNKAGLLPSSFHLEAFPNPFNPSTTLSFTLPKAGRTTLVVYDLLGQEVARLTDQVITAGEHTLRFDGSTLPSGIYFAKLQSGESAATQKLLLLK